MGKNEGNKKPRKPRLTEAQLNGLSMAVSFLLAGDLDNWSARDIEDIKSADEWLNKMAIYRNAIIEKSSKEENK